MFEGDLVYLRQLEVIDAKQIIRDLNNLELRKYLASVIPNSIDNEREWILRKNKQMEEGREYTFAICRKSDNQLIGTISLFNFNHIIRKAELGIAIYSQENWGKGYGTDALNILLKFGFDYLNLHKIVLHTYSYNERAISAYKKVGFKEMGRMRDERFWNGKYYDAIYMEVLENEWRQLKTLKHGEE